MGMVWVIALAALGAVAGGFLWSRSKSASPARAAPAPAATRAGAAAKAVASAAAESKLYEFHAARDGCAQAKRMNGRRVEPGNMVPVPLPGCGRTDCGCRFQLRTESRKKVRREKNDRRDELRFDKAGDERRQRNDRRKARGWSDHRHK